MIKIRESRHLTFLMFILFLFIDCLNNLDPDLEAGCQSDAFWELGLRVPDSQLVVASVGHLGIVSISKNVSTIALGRANPKINVLINIIININY